MFPCVSPAMNDIISLPKFSIMPQSLARYKPGHVYVRKHKQQVPIPLLDVDPPLDLPLDCVLDLPLDLVLVEPCRSSQISRAPDRYSPEMYDSSHTFSTAPLSSIIYSYLLLTCC